MKGVLLVNHDSPDYFGLGTMDVSIDASGHAIALTGRERVRHDVLKGVLTSRKGSYGTTVPSLIGQKRMEGFQALILGSIKDFIDNYRDAQPADVGDDERIESIRTVDIREHPSDRTAFLMTIVLNMADGQALEVEHRF